MKTFASILALFISLSEAATLSGTLKLRDHGEVKPHPDQPVMLHIFSRTRQAEIASAQSSTNAQGLYVFESLNANPDNIYLVKLEFDHVPYMQGPLVFQAGQTRILLDPLELVRSHSDPFMLAADTKVSLTMGRHDMIKVHQMIELSNLSSLTYSPTKDPSAQVVFSLPPGAFDFRWLNEETRDAFKADRNTGIQLIQALPTSNDKPWRLEFTYLAPYKDSTMNLPIQSSLGWREFELRMAGSSGIKLKSTPTLSPKGHDGSLYGQGLPKGEATHFTLTGLPLKNAPFRRVLYTGLILSLVLSVLFIFRPTHRLSQEERYQEILKQLRALGEARTQGKRSQDEFETENQRLRELAYTLLKTRKPSPRES